MKSSNAVRFPVVVLIVLIGMMSSQSMAQTVNVTITCNTSTCLDTLRPSHLVQVCGESKMGTTPAISWTFGSSITLASAGGDYWETTIQAVPGDTIQYKFVAGFDASTPTFHWSGWEGPLNSGTSFAGSNRALIVGNNDTTLALQYFNGWENTLDQYWRPFETKTDTIAVYFRVNMALPSFDPATQIVDVRGGAPMGADPTWITITTLARETNSVDDGSFWSGVAYLPKASVTPGVTQQQFKFVIQPDTWESVGNRSFTFAGTNDTTIHWYYFNNVAGSMGQTVNVKILCNTSTCLDTLRPNHVVKMLGESMKGTIPTMTWTVASGIVLTNVGGDYWETTIQAQPGDTIRYKFWTGFDDATGTFHWSGWEGPIDAGMPSGDNRLLIVGNSDTTLSLQYYNGWETTLAQYWRPYTSKPDSVAVYFRVNMGGASFDPATQVVDVRGGAPMGAADPWITIKTLAREPNSVNSGSFWSGVAYVAKDSVVPGTTQQEFKFVIQPNIWESVSNRSFTFASTNDTTIHWYYFNNVAPSGPKVTADLLFVLKLDALEKVNLFNRALGDRVAVTGAKGWPPDPFDFDTEPTMLKMTYDPGFKEWSLIESFEKFPGEEIPYKYYIAWDTSRVDSMSPNFIRGLDLTNGWEEPGVTGGADRRYIYGNTTQQTVPGDFGAEQQFFNSLHWKGAITNPIQVTFNINMAPAADVGTNPGTLFRPGIDTVYIQFDGSMVPITQGRTMWGTDNRLMLEDPQGDGTYTATYDLTTPTLYQFCYRLVYTSPTGEIWNGSGSAIRGRRYYQYVWPTQVHADSAIWPSTYSLALMPWMLDNLTIEDPPDLDQVTGIGDGESDLPGSYALRQNFPNPFNPSTVITYSIPENAHVKIEVYNVLGQKVASLFDQAQTVGTHSIAWNAQNNRGQALSSGVYLLRMQAGSFSEVKKMLLAK